MKAQHEGWHHALDTQLDTIKWLNQEYGYEFYRNFFINVFGDAGTEEDVYNTCVHVRSTLYTADTIFVTSDMQHILLQAAHDLPEEATIDPHTLLSKRGFVLYEEPMQGQDRRGKSVTLHALAWELARLAASEEYPDGREAIAIYFFTNPRDFNDDFNERYVEIASANGIPIPPLLIAHFYPAIVGKPLPPGDEQGSELIASMLKLFVAMNLIAQQKIGTPQRVPPPRATRRRIEREWPDDIENSRMITLITLRRKNVKNNEEPKDVPWTRRWVVRGHWRHQYYPKTKTHGWKYIYEYIKGPEDKPLVLTERRVFNFRR